MKLLGSKQVFPASEARFCALLLVALLVVPAAAALETPGTPAADGAEALPAVRYLTASEIVPYEQHILRALAMGQRVVDPFGRNQDPNFKPPVQEVHEEEGEHQEVAPVLTLRDVVSKIPVTIYRPAQQTFFVGDRAFTKGSKFPLRTGGTTSINVEVVSVSSAGITFRDVDKGETAVLPAPGGLPAGVQRGSSIETPPGVTIQNPSAPLDLQPTEVPPPPNR